MKILLAIPVFFLFLAVNAYSQEKVVEAYQVINFPDYRYIPDVAGKVLVDQTPCEIQKSVTGDDTVAVYPNWPVTKFGSNERGGVYGNMDNDPDLELVYSVGQKTYAFNLNGTAVGGWPRTLDYPSDGAPAYGDIDGDGLGEIVVTTHQTSTSANGKVYAFEKNGNNVQGFPVSTEGGPVRTPVLADMDDDGALEIIIAIRLWPEGFIHVYRGNGSMYPNFPVRMDYAPGSAVAFGDITGDVVPEIIAESYYSLHAFNLEGVILPGFPYFPGDGRVFSYSSPVLADLNGDGLREIICGDHSTNLGDGAVHVVQSDGTALPGWPKFTDNWIYGPPSVGDIDGDGELDVVVGDQVLSAAAIDKIYGWTGSTGNPLPGFPITNVFGINSQIILADIDGDGMVELMADDNTATNSMGRYRGFNHDGSEMEGWPLETFGTTFFINPLAVDINLDGILDLSGAATDQASGNTNIYLWNANVSWDPDLAILPILQYNTRHNGVYGDNLMVGTQESDRVDGLSFEIYPNPASDQLAVRSSQFAVSGRQSAVGGQQIFQLLILNLHGQKIQEFRDNSSLPFIIDIAGLNSGLYILQMISEDGHSGSRKFLKISD